jgi:polar amino acid transport system permease protein
MQMGWRWDFTFEILPQMAIATLNTILAAGVGYAIALIVGLFFLLGQKTPFNSVIFCLFCITTIWNYPISLGLWNDYYWSSFWNLFI